MIVFFFIASQTRIIKVMWNYADLLDELIFNTAHGDYLVFLSGDTACSFPISKASLMKFLQLLQQNQQET